MQRFLFVLIALILLVVGGFVAWKHFAAAQLPAEINGERVAAYVNGVPIFENYIALLASSTIQNARTVAKENAFTPEQKKEIAGGITSSTSPEAIRGIVLTQAINEEILTQAGLKRNFATDEIVRKAIAEQKSYSLKDPHGKEVIAIAAKQIGVDPAKYWDDPRVFESYRRMVARSAMESYIKDHMTRAEQDAPRPIDQAIADFITAEHANVVIK